MKLPESQHAAKGIYVEIEIRSSIDELWAKTQLPALHQRWDLRFTEIEYLPRPNLSEPQQFLYATRIGFGMKISGKGETLGTQENDGSKTSALKFWSNDPKSMARAAVHTSLSLFRKLAKHHVSRAGEKCAVLHRELRLSGFLRTRNRDLDPKISDANAPAVRRLHDS